VFLAQKTLYCFRR